MARSAGDPRIPDKQYFRIGEVAEIADVEAYVLRFWESEFSSLAPSKSRANQRRYSRKDVELVLRIRDLLYEEGYTIAGAKRQLRKRNGIEPPEVPARTRAVIDRVRRDVAALLQLVDE
jgi:DNA-binding transcriptional MerR regulator